MFPYPRQEVFYLYPIREVVIWAKGQVDDLPAPVLTTCRKVTHVSRALGSISFLLLEAHFDCIVGDWCGRLKAETSCRIVWVGHEGGWASDVYFNSLKSGFCEWEVKKPWLAWTTAGTFTRKDKRMNGILLVLRYARLESPQKRAYLRNMDLGCSGFLSVAVMKHCHQKWT